jgi:hypothetical protein
LFRRDAGEALEVMAEHALVGEAGRGHGVIDYEAPADSGFIRTQVASPLPNPISQGPQ